MTLWLHIPKFIVGSADNPALNFCSYTSTKTDLQTKGIEYLAINQVCANQVCAPT